MTGFAGAIGVTAARGGQGGIQHGFEKAGYLLAAGLAAHHAGHGVGMQKPRQIRRLEEKTLFSDLKSPKDFNSPPFAGSRSQRRGVNQALPRAKEQRFFASFHRKQQHFFMITFLLRRNIFPAPPRLANVAKQR